MCLLAGAEYWDEERIVCTATSHRDEVNPLRNDGRLDAVCGIEYAAQAMAVHGAMAAAVQSGQASPGFIVSVPDVSLHCERLDLYAEPLRITATRAGDSVGVVSYEFTIDCGGETLLDGRVVVRLLGEEGGR